MTDNQIPKFGRVAPNIPPCEPKPKVSLAPKYRVIIAAECQAHPDMWVETQLPWMGAKARRDFVRRINSGRAVTFRSQRFEAALDGAGTVWVRYSMRQQGVPGVVDDRSLFEMCQDAPISLGSVA